MVPALPPLPVPMPALRDDWSAALLIGGQGRRLGGADKSSLVVGGRTILARQLDTLACCALPVVLVTRPGDGSRPDLPTLVDHWTGCGPLAGIHTALAHARTSHVLVLAGDLPFLTPSFLGHMMSVASPDACVVPHVRGRLHPLCAAYPASAVQSVGRRLAAGSFAVRDLFEDLPHRLLEEAEVEAFDPDGMLLFNVNTPDDLQLARRYADQVSGAHRTAASVDRQTSAAGLFV